MARNVEINISESPITDLGYNLLKERLQNFKELGRIDSSISSAIIQHLDIRGTEFFSHANTKVRRLTPGVDALPDARMGIQFQQEREAIEALNDMLHTAENASKELAKRKKEKPHINYDRLVTEDSVRALNRTFVSKIMNDRNSPVAHKKKSREYMVSTSGISSLQLLLISDQEKKNLRFVEPARCMM